MLGQFREALYRNLCKKPYSYTILFILMIEMLIIKFISVLAWVHNASNTGLVKVAVFWNKKGASFTKPESFELLGI